MIEEIEVNFRLNLINSSLKFGCWKGSRLKREFRFDEEGI